MVRNYYVVVTLCIIKRCAVVVLNLLRIGAVYGRLNVNVAFNRPTFMSSVYSYAAWGGAFDGWKAVDVRCGRSQQVLST